MGVKKNRLKRGLVLALTLALVGNGMSSTMLTALAEENEPEVTDVQDTSKKPRVEKPEDKGEPEGAGTGQKKDNNTKTVSDNGKKEEDEQVKNETENTGEELSKTAIETIVPDSVEDFPDNDELFAGYVDQLFFAELNSDIATLADFGKIKLTGINFEIYNVLKEEIKKIAAGEKTSTEIPYTIAWSAADLGLNNATGQQIYDAGFKKFEAEYNSASILNYLLMDSPYELYWYDKTEKGGMASELAYSYNPSDGKFKVNITYQFSVAKGYQGDTYQIDAAKARSTVTAVTNAKNIVEKYEGKSDFEKLDGYRQEICDLVSYNNDAAKDQDPVYGDPWQLIWVFDGNTATNVVCEGYSKAFQYLCDMSQFSGADTVCYTVSGDMIGGTGAGPHMWNIVTLEGKNYLVDVTNCDTRTIGAPKKLFLAGIDGNVKDGYIFPLSYDIEYKYDENQEGLFGSSILTLASENYVPRDILDITPPTVTTIIYGDTVDRANLQGGSAVDSQKQAVAGTFDWADNVKTSGYGDAGKKTLQVVFTPNDTTKYNQQAVSIEVTVGKRPIKVMAAAVTKTYGSADPELTYEVDNSTPLIKDDKLSGALSRESGEDVKDGGYNISRGTLANTNYEITFVGSKLTITPAQIKDNTAKTQNILEGVGTFEKPVFAGVRGEALEGSLIYEYKDYTGKTYDELKSILDDLPKNSEGDIKYSFTPSSKNYLGTNGKIHFTIKDIEFVVSGNIPATSENAVTVKKDAVYGDKWSDIVELKSITAKVGNASDSNTNNFTVENADGIPDAGSNQVFRVLYNGTLGGKEYTNAEVCRGTVNIAKRTLTVSAEGYKVSKVYDGTQDTTTATTTGTLTVNGVLDKDKGIVVKGTLGNYTSADVGVDKLINVSLTLEGNGADNYALDKDVIAVPCEIVPKDITPSIVIVPEDFTYTGQAITPKVEVYDGQTKLPDTAFKITYANNVNAGQGKIIVNPAERGNYSWTSKEEYFQIAQADYTIQKENAQSTKYGNIDTYNLTRCLQNGAQLGAKFGQIRIEGDSTIFEGTPSIRGMELSYKLVQDETKVGQTVVIIVPVETTNFKPYEISIKVTVSAKQQQDNFKFDLSSSEVKKTYGDGDFTVAVQGAAEGSTVSYESNNTSVATVDAASGSVHILRQGTAAITATASETDDYISKSVTYTLTVTPKALTWDVSGLQAVNKQGTIDKDKKAALYGELRVSGILSADNGKVSYSCPAEKLTGIYADTKPGAQKVTLNWSGEPAVLEGTDVDNYTLPGALPEITGRINAVTEQTNVPESTDTVKYKLEVEDGISQVPATLKENPDLNTPAKIEEKMKTEIRISLKEESNQNSIEVYDVVLMVKDGDGEWKVASEENFPKDGLTVTLPYPEGTGKNTHNFEIAHMFTHDMRGHKPGEIERPTASKLDEGIQFRVTSLSPVAIGWKEIKADNNGANGNTNTAATAPNKSRSPQTGDENAVMLYVLLMLLGAAGVGFTMRRKAIR